jgi:hypothetical protein
MRLVRDHPSLRGAVSMLLVAVYLVASLGVIPSPRVIMGWFGQLATERYPCESCGCGCASATECWTHCCCHTEHQRLVWAISNGVLPPPVVEFSDEQWIAAANAVKPGNAHCVMCVERIKGELRAGVATKPIHDPACVCDSSADRGCGKTRCGTAVASETGGGGLVLRQGPGQRGAHVARAVDLGAFVQGSSDTAGRDAPAIAADSGCRHHPTQAPASSAEVAQGCAVHLAQPRCSPTAAASLTLPVR